MSIEKMRESFEAWYEKEQVENTLFPSILKMFIQNKIVLYSVWQAALAQQASEPQVSLLVAETYIINRGEPSEFIAIDWKDKEGSYVGLLYSSPPDYEELKDENESLKLRVTELEAATEHLGLTPQQAKDGLARYKADLAERDSLKARVAELQSECEKLRNRPFDCWSNDDGDSWGEHPADGEFVDGLKVGDTFELLAGYQSERVSYIVTKAPDDANDDYEVEQAK